MIRYIAPIVSILIIAGCMAGITIWVKNSWGLIVRIWSAKPYVPEPSPAELIRWAQAGAIMAIIFLAALMAQ